MCDLISGYIRVSDGAILAAHPASHSGTAEALRLKLDVREAHSEWEWKIGGDLVGRNMNAATAKRMRSSILARFPSRESLLEHCRPAWERHGHYLIETKADARRVPVDVPGDVICTMAQVDLAHVASIGGSAYFRALTDAAGLSALALIGGSAYFRALTDAAGLSALASIGGSAYFRALTDAAGLSALASIGCYADFRALTDAAGLSALASIGGSAYFRALTDAQRALIPALSRQEASC